MSDDPELYQERLAEFRRALRDADDHYADDVMAAKGDKALLAGIDRNYWAHERNWTEAALAALGRQDAQIQAAHDLAKKANDDIDARRAAAASLPALIKAGAKAAAALKSELDAAAKAEG